MRLWSEKTFSVTISAAYLYSRAYPQPKNVATCTKPTLAKAKRPTTGKELYHVLNVYANKPSIFLPPGSAVTFGKVNIGVSSHKLYDLWWMCLLSVCYVLGRSVTSARFKRNVLTMPAWTAAKVPKNSLFTSAINKLFKYSASSFRGTRSDGSVARGQRVSEK